MWRCSLVPQSTSNSVSENSVSWDEHRNTRRSWGFNNSSQNALRFDIKPMPLETIVKWQNFKISCFFHVTRDSGAPRSWRRGLRQICAWVEQRNSRRVRCQKIKSKGPPIFEIKPIPLATIRNGFC